MLCRHCGKKNSSRPMGLCWGCYYSPVKNSYRSTSKYASRGIGTKHTDELPEPTTAIPGTPEKIQVLIERAEKNQVLFHPKDGIKDEEKSYGFLLALTMNDDEWDDE